MTTMVIINGAASCDAGNRAEKRAGNRPLADPA